MCGISGIILKTKGACNPIQHVLAMSHSISHRGPDGEGLVLFADDIAIPFKTKDTPPANINKINYIPQKYHHDFLITDANKIIGAFAHRRLAVIDLSMKAHQPMCTDDAKVWISYNGEIYNYKYLRTELQQAGFIFRSDSDTEVILNSYLHWGEDCVKRFDGMWAFGIFDYRKMLFFASRDRLGVKPFYYLNTSDYISFASEQKAFVKGGMIRAEADRQAIYDYLINDITENRTQNFFNNINELLPAHNLRYKIGESNPFTYSYYDINTAIHQNNNTDPHEVLIEEIKNTLASSVNAHLQADVGIAVALSGGIDSSSIACLVAKQQMTNLHCYSIVFPEYSFNEEQYSSRVVEYIGGVHHKVIPTADEFITQLESLVYALDVPIWYVSTFSQFKMMQEIKNNKVKVVLSGQGGDELFAGYNHHYISYWKQLYKNDGVALMCREMHNASPFVENPYLFYLKEFIKEYLPVKKMKALHLLRDEFVESFSYSNVQYHNELNEQLKTDLGYTRLKSYLRCEDRCSMWHGIESRLPFADDSKLLHLMFNIDGRNKIKNGVNKYYLREACKDIIPQEIYLRRDKKGFTSPAYNWINASFGHMKEQILSADFDFVDKKKLQKMSKTDKNVYSLFFKLYVLALWNKCFS